MDKPVVTVLLATCNGLPWIGEQVRSILEQEHVSVEIVVSDDMSTDGTGNGSSRSIRVNRG